MDKTAPHSTLRVTPPRAQTAEYPRPGVPSPACDGNGLPETGDQPDEPLHLTPEVAAEFLREIAAPPVLPAPDDDPAMMLDLARRCAVGDRDAIALLLSESHTHALCTLLIGTFDSEARWRDHAASLAKELAGSLARAQIAQGVADRYAKLIDETRDAGLVVQQQLVAEMERSSTLHAKLVVRDAENAAARRATLELSRRLDAIRALTQPDAPSAAPRSARVRQPHRDRDMTARRFDVTDQGEDETVVVDPPIRK